MQDRYTGDIGDFAKYGLLRALAKGYKLGIAWYLYPDESHNSDGRHIDYLKSPEKWRELDSELFDQLKAIVKTDRRQVSQIVSFEVLGKAQFSESRLAFSGSPQQRAMARAQWFGKVLKDLEDCEIIFADPDNGLCEDGKYSMGTRSFWKRIPESEAHELSAGRIGIIYHHNTRRAGGHKKEIQYWLDKLGQGTIALYWRHISNRTFFILHPTPTIRRRAEKFAETWSPWFELHKLHGH